MVKINVLILTYKQQSLIGRAIESVLTQKAHGLNKIVICDDCSPDDNWKVICDYRDKNPDLIDAYRNENNLGIYGNMNRLVSLKGDADLFNIMAGDDVLCEGWFENIQKFIKECDINITGQVGIFSDWANVYPDGRHKVYAINQIVSNPKYSVLGLHLRGLASTRSMLVSKMVLEKIHPVDTTKGIGYAETMFNMQCSANVNKAYYMKYVGSVYYCGIGVSANLDKFDDSYFTKGRIQSSEDLAKEFKLNKKDEYWLNHQIEISRFFMTHSITCAIKSVFYFVLGTIGYPRFFNKLALLFKTILSGKN